MSKTRKTCVIAGAGFMGETHAAGYARHPDKVKVVGVIDSDLARATALAEPFGAKAFTTLEDAFASSQVDFLDVCLPSPLHAEYATKAMDLGADVVVEKPFSISLEDADLMLEKANETGRRLFVAHVCRFMPQYVRAKELLRAGAIGDPISLFCSRISPRPAWGHQNWFLDKELSGGTLLDLSIHDIDLALWLLGEPVGHEAVIHEHAELAGIAHTTSSLQFANGSDATVIASHLMPDGYNLTTEFLLVGTKGVIEFSSKADPATLFISTDGERNAIPLSEIDAEALEDPYAAELSHFVDCLISGEEFAFTALEARQALATVHELYDSATLLKV